LIKKNVQQINYNIKARRVLVIDEHGKKMGEFLRDDAIKLAADRSLDLVRVSDAQVPVCKLMDWGKHVYDRKKKQKATKASSTRVKMKEVRMSPRIADGDLNVRANQIKNFISKGNQVKVAMKFKGADMRHIDIGRERCNDLIALVEDVAVVDQPPRMSGRFMTLTFVPR